MSKHKQALFVGIVAAVVAAGRVYGCDSEPQKQPEPTGMPIVVHLPDVEIAGDAADVTATWLPDAQTSGAQ